jgi:hypothetical protein
MIDCCGILAPMVALELASESVGLKIDLVAVSDNNPLILNFIQKHWSPAIVWDDMLTRDPSTLPQNIDLYISGFMCTPWSKRRAGSSLLWEEPASKTLKASVDTISALKPTLALFENVPGLLKTSVWREVTEMLNTLTGYTWAALPPKLCSPTSFGFPVRRERLYICVARSDTVPQTDKYKSDVVALMQSFASDVDMNFETALMPLGSGPAVGSASPRAVAACTCTLARDCSRLMFTCMSFHLHGTQHTGHGMSSCLISIQAPMQVQVVCGTSGQKIKVPVAPSASQNHCLETVQAAVEIWRAGLRLFQVEARS